MSDASAILRESLTGTDDVSWAAVPQVWLNAQRLASRGGSGVVREALRHVLIATAGDSPLELHVSDDGITMAIASINQSRTLKPIMDALRLEPGARRFTRCRPRTRRTEAISRTRDAVAAAGRMSNALHDARLPVDRRSVLRTVLKGARAISADLSHTQVLVVATQHDPSVRGLLHAAHAHGVPSIYVPHAPTASNAIYRDLPTVHAALRGSRDVEHYLTLGADPEGMHVVGAPGVSVATELASIDPESPVVFAMSPWSEEILREQINLVDDARGAKSVVVATHPRQDPARIERMLPSHWRVHNGTTQSLLARGPWCVIQSSSGVAWEALAGGIPTIELCQSNEPNYTIIDPDVVSFVRDGSDLRRALEEARRASRSGAERARLRAWARQWCDTTGSDAAERVCELVRASISCERRQIVLDGWAR